MSALRIWSIGPGADEPVREVEEPFAQSLAAVRRLAQASTASLVEAGRASGTARLVATAGAAEAETDAAAMLAATEADGTLFSAASQAVWVEEAVGPGAMMVVRVAEREGSVLLLVLGFAEAAAVTRARLAKLVPDLVALVAAQVEAAARLGAALEREAAAAAALDHGDCGVIALRADHGVLFANRAAAAMLAEGDGLQVRRGLVRPSDYREAVRSEAALDAVLEAPRAERAGKPPALVMLLPRGRDARPMILVIAPAPVPAGPGAAAGRCALVYLLPAGQGMARGLDTLARLHGLSRVETRLLANLCGGMTVSESAGQMRIKLETARAYLKQIFAKTGTHRQTELVTLMTRYLRAIRGDFDFQPA